MKLRMRRPIFTENAEQGARRSAEALDQVRPDWYREITGEEIDALDQRNPFRCVLYLSFGCYQRGMTAVRGVPGFRTACSTWAFHPPENRAPAVNRAWQAEVRSRQAAERTRVRELVG